jgi:hypothetical protein
MASGKAILYTAENGEVAIQLKVQDGTVCLTRSAISELFQIAPQNVTMHVRDIYNTNEVDAKSTSKEYLLVQNEGARSVERTVKLYNLQVVLKLIEKFIGIGS